jgi:phospholipid transport system transporter-binding protein
MEALVSGLRRTPMSAFALPAVLTHAQANASVAAFATHLKAGRCVSIDASALQQFDSAALAVLLACRRLALEGGQVLQVVGLSTRLQALARLYGVQDLLRIG